jgi:hypothetical protein
MMDRRHNALLSAIFSIQILDIEPFLAEQAA